MVRSSDSNDIVWAYRGDSHQMSEYLEKTSEHFVCISVALEYSKSFNN